MTGRIALLWDQKLLFSRFIEECGACCDHVPPQMLATPFFRGSYSVLVVPAGFANPAYSRLLPALRASTRRIRGFVENGGYLLAFGAGTPKPDAYDWLPLPIVYRHDPHPRRLTIDSAHPASTLLCDYDTTGIECDGDFPSHGGTSVAEAEGSSVFVAAQIGSGWVAVTAIHEYPSRCFITGFCSGARETLF